MSQTQIPSPGVQKLIRYGMLSGIVLFGAVVFFLQSSDSLAEPVLDSNRSPVAIVLSVLVLASVAAIPLFHRLVHTAETPERRFRITLVGLAVCEAAAMAGGVLWILSGTWTLYAVGLGVFIVAMIWLDPDHASEAPA